MSKTMTIISNQGPTKTQKTYYCPEGATARGVAKKHLVAQGVLATAEDTPDEDTMITLRNCDTGQDLSPDAVVFDDIVGDHSQYEVVHTDVAGDPSRGTD